MVAQLPLKRANNYASHAQNPAIYRQRHFLLINNFFYITLFKLL